MSSSLLLPGLVLGAALTVGMAIGLAKAIDKLTLGKIRPRLVFSNRNDDKDADSLREENEVLLEENKCLRDEIVSLRYRIHADRDRFLYLDKEIQELGGPKRLLSTSRAAWRDPRRSESPSPRSRCHADRDHATPTRTNTRSRCYVGVVEPSTPLSSRRTTSMSPARHFGIPGEADGRGSLTKKEKRAAESERAAEWARKRKEQKAS